MLWYVGIACTVLSYLPCIQLDTPPLPALKVVLPHGGILVGSYMTSANKNLIKAFRGIPYAEPPIGKLRFEAPVPAKSWSGERLADKDPSVCPSHNPYMDNYETMGDENCLYLNVYTPEEPESSAPLSVMVYLHGGGFITGNGNSALHGPERLLDHNVILVVGNYRLGALGFLSTGTLDCPGNFGMKDQVMMLKWVKDNIEAFGGNPHDVTVFGQSAGAASIGFHIYSEVSKGLFQKAILQSGTNFDLWALAETSVMKKRALQIGKALNCSGNSDDDWKGLIACLRSKPALEIASTVKPLFKYGIDPNILFPVVVEPEGKNAFITKRPEEILIMPSASVSVIIGITSGEGIVDSRQFLQLLKDPKNSFEKVLPISLFYDDKSDDLQQEWTKQIDQFYLKGKQDFGAKNYDSLTNLFTDAGFTWGMDKFLRYRFEAAKRTKVGSTYVYLFDHRGPMSLSQTYDCCPKYLGVAHEDDLVYIFDFKLPIGNENDNKMKWAMPQMWTNFAKTGNPTPRNCSIGIWQNADKFPLEYARIGRQNEKNWAILTNEIGLLEDRVNFWRELEKSEK